VPEREVTNYRTDRRRRHHHWLAMVTHSETETFGRVFIGRERAEKFVAWQKKSPVVLKTRIRQLS